MNIFKVLCGVAFVASSVSAYAANPLITFDLRLADGSKSAQVSKVGDSVSLALYAIIRNSDGNYANDGYSYSSGKIVSSETGLLMGNLSTLATSVVTANALSTSGVPTNLDGNADLELGSTNPASSTGWISLTTSASPNPYYGSGTGSNNVEFLLGTLTWTATSVGSGTTSLQYAVREKVDGSSSAQKMVKFYSDGQYYTFLYNDSNIAYGSAVQVVPEPMTLAMLAMGGVAMLRRKLA